MAIRFTTIHNFDSLSRDFILANGHPVPKRPDEFRFNCPYCDREDGKLYVNIRNGYYKCWRGHIKGRIGNRPSTPGLHSLEIQPVVEKKVIDYVLFDIQRDTFESQIVQAYLSSRGINDHIIRSFGLKGASLLGCFAVAFPVMTPLTTLNHWGFRLINHAKLRYYTDFPKKIYGHPGTLTVDDLYIMEGPFDVLCSIPFSAVALFGKSPTAEQLLFLRNFVCKRFLICLDGSVSDSHKESYALQVRMITGKDVGIVELPRDKDPGDLREAVKDFPIRGI